MMRSISLTNLMWSLSTVTTTVCTVAQRSRPMQIEDVLHERRLLGWLRSDAADEGRTLLHTSFILFLKKKILDNMRTLCEAFSKRDETIDYPDVIRVIYCN